MSDEVEDTNSGEPKKQLKGFANKEQRKNINRSGRKKGAAGRTNFSKQFIDEIKSGSPKAAKRLVQMMDSDNEAHVFKASVKIADLMYSIMLDEEAERLTIRKKKSTAKPIEDQEDGEDSNVMVFSMKARE